MKKTLQKMIDDTLKEPNGKWSRKSLTMFTAFACGILSGFYIVFMYETYSLEVYIVFMMMATGQSILAYKEKKNSLNKENNDNESNN